MNFYSMGIRLLRPTAARPFSPDSQTRGTQGRRAQPPAPRASSSPASAHWVDRIRLSAPR
jgi:hypothetical protein